MKQDKPAAATGTVEDRSQEFKAVTGSSTETSSAEALLITAYVLMWAILMGFLFVTFRRQAAVDKRLGDLERALPKRPDA
ncbi:MAG: CcmD family protein [Myxococcales bacterium]|nr:MAG: CcmD family protein [Myxococcales bacterium]